LDTENISEYLTYGEAEYCIKLFPENFKGVCVDIGAFDPFWISNSYLFNKLGWDVYCIEPNPHCIPKLKAYRKNVLQYACGSENKDDVDFYIFSIQYAGPQNGQKLEEWYGEAAASGLIKHTGTETIPQELVKVNVRTLDWLMENEIRQNHIDLLSIDVERNEIDVLRGIDLNRWNPKVIIIESLYNLDHGKDISNMDIDPIQGEYLGRFGYKFIHRIPVNDIYIKI
jgi:FkbM family methyltransferase